MRQIILDTETTGISPLAGHRIIEIGCVEVIDRKITGKTYQTYLNPERDIDEGAFRVHGISREMLVDKPLFSSVISEFIRFIAGAELVIHNAPFDIGFLNAELSRCKKSEQIQDYCQVCDTLLLSRKKSPGQRHSLDVLCKRYHIDNSHRAFHGALLDAQILAEVYLAMTGGQVSLFNDEKHLSSVDLKQLTTSDQKATTMPATPIIYPNQQELEAHSEFVEFLIKKSGINNFRCDEIPE